jgi:hypothetical protein
MTPGATSIAFLAGSRNVAARSTPACEFDHPRGAELEHDPEHSARGIVSFGPFRLSPKERLLAEADVPIDVGGRALDIRSSVAVGAVRPPLLGSLFPAEGPRAIRRSCSCDHLRPLDFSFLAEERWGGTSITAVAGVWSVVVALAAAIVTVIMFNRSRLPSLRQSMDAGANASVLPALSVASLVRHHKPGAAHPTRCRNAPCSERAIDVAFPR